VAVEVVIIRLLPFVKLAAFTRNDPFPARTHEIALDRIVMMIQQTETGSGGGGGGDEVSPEYIQDIVGMMFLGNGITFSYDDLAGTITGTVTSPGLPDAPIDGIYYVRKDGNWIQMDWANIANKPATFPPTTHTHNSGDITDLTETVQDLVAPMLVHSGHVNVSFTYNDTTGVIDAVAQAGATTPNAGQYDWDDTTTMADPGAGLIRGNTATMNTITAFAINHADKNGAFTNIFAAGVGDTIIISNANAATPGKYTIGSKTVNSGWTQFGVTADTGYSTGNPSAGHDMTVSGVSAGGGGSGIPEAPNDGVYYTRRNLGWVQGAYSGLSGIPSSFPPNPHTHVIADITDFPTDIVKGPASVTTGRVAVFNGTTGKLIQQGTQLAADLVSGPGSSTNANIAVMSGTTGKIIADGGATIASITNSIATKETIGEYSAINAQTGTTYTLALSDKGCLVTLSNASAITLTIPPNSSVAFPVKSKIDSAAYGAGQVTIAPGAGVTLRAAGGALKSRVQYTAWTMVKIATDEWLVFGDLTT
jgi:hypothetical protein